MKQKKHQNIILLFLFFADFLSLIPILTITKFTGMVLDDYSYAANTHVAWINTHSLIDAFIASIKLVKKYWYSWQGSIISDFLFAFNPACFGEKYYWINGIAMILSLVVSLSYLVYTVFYERLKCNRNSSLVLLFLLIWIYINLLPSSSEGFYFFNDACNYTFFYSLICFHVGMMTRLSSNNYCNKLLYVVDVIVGFFSAGGHLSMAVFSLVLTTTFLGYHLMNKTEKIKSFIGISLSVIISLLINALAPGYRNRSMGKGGKSFASSIFWGFVQTFKETNSFFRIETILVIAVFFVLFFEISETSIKKIDHPIMLSCFSIILYSTQFMPAFYAIGHAEFLRQQNIAFFSFFWLLGVLIFIWIIYFRQNGLNLSFSYDTFPHFSLLFIVLFIVSILGTGDLNKITAVSATRAILNGTAAGYSQERMQWIETIENSEDGVAIIHPIKNRVDVVDPLGVFDIATDWVLESMAKYYDIEKIELIEEY